ncbi:MAG: carboxypeptidase regulatory-like domain-containing protein [Thermoplasmata archaeon]|nr:MAG: carboxypeptidase regulatory-like domain-containing protein [Thermoplasmata archaeon]
MEENQNEGKVPSAPAQERRRQGYPYPPYGGPQRPYYDVHYHYYYEPPKAKPGKSIKPTVAGALLIIHAITTFVLVGFLILAGLFVGNMGRGVFFFGIEDNTDVTGTIVYENGTPAEGVLVSVVGESRSTTTNEYGNYYLYNVPAGNQELRVEKEGYNTIIYKAFFDPTDSSNNTDFQNEFDFTLTEGNQTLERGSHLPLELIMNLIYVCAVILVVFSIIALIGGIYAIQRKKYGIALLGSIVGVFSGGLFPLIALFILLLSKDEFKPKDETPPPATPPGGPQPSEGPP